MERARRPEEHVQAPCGQAVEEKGPAGDQVAHLETEEPGQGAAGDAAGGDDEGDRGRGLGPSEEDPGGDELKNERKEENAPVRDEGPARVVPCRRHGHRQRRAGTLDGVGAGAVGRPGRLEGRGDDAVEPGPERPPVDGEDDVARVEPSRLRVERLDPDAVGGPGVGVEGDDGTVRRGEDAQGEERKARQERAHGQEPDPQSTRVRPGCRPHCPPFRFGPSIAARRRDARPCPPVPARVSPPRQPAPRPSPRRRSRPRGGRRSCGCRR
ncbi:MAG: hypothetical protein KatS3mg065_0005 [Chloroflexota bacterium]|nr:MAG: hypothetical protein KatS3mg065_0005 [Chloroflexota bacterium]